VLNEGYELVAISALKRHPRNVNRGDLVAIGDSITENGFYGAVVAQRSTGYTLAGNHRYEAAQTAGLSEVPVIWVDVDDDRALRILLVDNRTTRLGEDDQEALAVLLQQILSDSETLAGTGYDEAALDALLAEVGVTQCAEGLTDEDAVPEQLSFPVTEPGDLWLLGKHRLLCGDSTSINAVDRLMGSEKADVIFTDPPYGYEFESNHYKDGNPHGMLKNDDTLLDFLPNAYACAKENAALFVCASHQTAHQWRELIDQYFTYKNLIVWKKNNWSMGDLEGAFAGQHELIFFAHKGRVTLRGERSRDIWEFDREPPKDHPTQKPVELVAFAIDKTSDIGALVTDFFGGSGSTLIACEKTGRSARVMELDPKYCDVIVDRWQQFTGKEAKLESGKTFNKLKSKHKAA
jgi:DNA modification methylase